MRFPRPRTYVRPELKKKEPSLPGSGGLLGLRATRSAQTEGGKPFIYFALDGWPEVGLRF